jgi:16S rRNA (guanine(966)-N(2))-methyltransferase RsmD
MTRIIAGRGKGRRLKAPRGTETRPTGARVRQTLFDILAEVVPGCRFLDAFAGAGGVGLEALSRGAERVVFVDRAAAAVAAVRANLAAVGSLGGDAQVFRQEARVALRGFAAGGFRFDVVYVDPPYESGEYEPVLEQVEAVLAPGGVAVAEHFHKRRLPERIGALVRTRSERVGDHRLSFYRRQEEHA